MKRYVIGLNVNDSSELPQAATDIQAFIDTLGVASEMEIQVSINPLLTQPESTNVIGFMTEDDEYCEEEDE
ncbi:hypothetical protein [Lysinibacillus xylanilyticus]|uniref:Uncharacterized protein n=1 Tax=Lysinibacillus xylanilyticus TaxID=582475 RepID=A0ABT4EMF3_9BACI|nr:hypothetical protein [Lysinibacillus xylanilyticus]MCY9546806.1 hypothetical protein [Lysinibacillus xylanilyticus]